MQKLKPILKIVGFGVILWLVPFIVSIPFFSREGELQIDRLLFKNIMVVISTFTGGGLMLFYLRNLSERFLSSGILSGFVWLVINWLLDVLILLPMNGQTIDVYFTQIGLGYLAMPIIGFFMGSLAQSISKK